MDPDPHSFSFLDPDPGRKIFQIITEKCKEIGNSCKFIQFLRVNLHKLYCFLLLSNLMCFTTKKTHHRVIFTNFSKLDPDPQSEKLQDPDPQKMTANPQPPHPPLLINVGTIAQYFLSVPHS